MEITGQQFIGNTRSSEGTETFFAVNPRTSQQLAHPFFEATSGEIDRAATLAEQAFDEYRDKTPAEIARFLEAIGDQIEALGDRLLQQTQDECGLTMPRLEAERKRTLRQAKLFADVVREGSWVQARIDHATQAPDALTGVDLRQMQIPLGPVAVFGASNFPLAISVVGNDTISALAAGCPVVVKAHPGHPGTCELLAHAVRAAISETDMPPGVFSMVQGATHRVGEKLVSHPLINGVGFTGSLAGGRALFDVAMRRPVPIPFFAEMGSINPVFILPGELRENQEQLASEFVKSMTASCGQMCTQPGLLVAQNDSALEAFVARTGELVQSAQPQTMLHPGILSAYTSGVETIRKLSGVVVRHENIQKVDREDHAAHPVLFETSADTFLDSDVLNQEVFGPASVLVRCSDTRSLEHVARTLEGSLTATIRGTEADLMKHRKLVSILQRKTGRLIFNDFPTGVAVCHAMNHSGPYPATIDGKTTSIGTASINRWARPICYQNFPDAMLPSQLKDANPDKLWRLMDGEFGRG